MNFNCSKIIIGRVQGKAVGGGVGLAAACDYCLATEAASIKLSELSIGIGINYGKVMRVLGELSGSGFSKVALITKPITN